MSLSSRERELVERHEEAHRWLLSLIRPDGGDWSLRGQPWRERVRRHRAKQASTAEFLEFVGRPQDRIRSVVVVGTSGKGSVTAIIAALLRDLGFAVADHTSPYLQLPTEKMRLGGRPIGPGAFADAVAELRSHVERWRDTGRDLRYGQAWAALVMLWMARSGCDFGVYEASVGGRFSNAALLEPDVAVITNVGLDHVETLGPTLDKIAWHKAGVAAHARVVVSGERSAQPAAIIDAEARRAGVELVVAEPLVGSADDHLAQNEATALAAVRALGRVHGFEGPDEVLERVRSESALPGRYEVVQRHPRVILDGAHNADKVSALARKLAIDTEPGRTTVLFGALGVKSLEPMLAALAPVCSRLIATEPRVHGKPARPAVEVADAAVSAGWSSVVVQPDARAALTGWLAAAEAEESLVVTGSMYLVGDVRERWFPSLDLLIDGILTQVCDKA